ncbi:MAG: 3-hydroxyacyl-CoA dehydrogenase NAD-binding domain-containing protein, partial [Planctomycetaceae bacterium]
MNQSLLCAKIHTAMPLRAVLSVSVVGVVLMGQSIAALHLARGMHVTIADSSEAAATAGVESILNRTEHFA